MTDTYTQLFTGYVHDVQWRLRKSEEETLDELIQSIPHLDEHRADLADGLTALRSRCFSESFALGIELGLRIAWEFSSR